MIESQPPITNTAVENSPTAPSRRFSTNVALTLVTRVLMLATGLGASIIIARWLGPDGLGTLSVLNVTVALAVQLGCAGLPSANTYFISKSPGVIGRAWTNSLIFGVAAGTALVLIVTMLVRLAPGLFGDVPMNLIIIAAISIPFQLVTLLGLNVFIALGRIDRLNVMELFAQLLPFVNAIVILVLVQSGLRDLITLNTIAAVLISVAVGLMVGRVISGVGGGGLRADVQLFKEFVRYGARFHVAVLAGIVILRADLLLVNNYRGAEEAGVYAVATQISSLLLLLPAVIATLLFPRVTSEMDPTGQITIRTTRVTALIMVLMCLAAVPGSLLLPYLYGVEFSQATLLLSILIPGVYLLGIEAVVVQHFNATGLPKAIPLFWILTVAFNLAFNVLFIPVHGAVAAAVISSLSYALIFCLVTGYFVVKTGTRFSQLLLIRPNDVSSMLHSHRSSFTNNKNV